MTVKRLLVILFLFGFRTVFAASGETPDFMRSMGKIYVVAGVCLVILITLFIFIIQLDRKVSRLEKRQNHE